MLGVARRSLNCNDELLLGNDSIITRNHADLDIGRVTSRILDELVLPLREIQINDHELAYVKAMVFFDPSKLKTVYSNHYIET